jgi:transposase-like protein
MKRKANKFPDELAIQIATEYLTTDMGYQDLMEKYNFSGHGNIPKWIRKFGLSKPNQQEPLRMKSKKSEPQRTRREQELEREIAKLRQDVEYERLRASAYDKLIDIAETNLNISIRKKSGTKR